MNLDDLDDDFEPIEEFTDYQQQDDFYYNPDSELTTFVEEELEDEIDDWIYSDIFAGTNKVKTRDDSDLPDNSKWDSFKI